MSAGQVVALEQDQVGQLIKTCHAWYVLQALVVWLLARPVENRQILRGSCHSNLAKGGSVARPSRWALGRIS